MLHLAIITLYLITGLVFITVKVILIEELKNQSDDTTKLVKSSAFIELEVAVLQELQKRSVI